MDKEGFKPDENDTLGGEAPENRDAEEAKTRKVVGEKWMKEVEGIDGNQVINVHATGHSAGETSTHKITAGEFKKRLEAAIENTDYGWGVVVHFDDGGAIDFAYHDFYGIEEVTPEVEAGEEEETRNWKIIEGLKAMGVDERIFVDYPEFGNANIKFTPHQIMEIGKKVEEYLKEQREKNN